MVKPTEEEDRKTVIFGGGGKGETLDRSTVSVPVTKPYPTLCDLMDYSMPGFPVLHCLLEFAQTHAHWVGDAIQRSKDLMSSNITVISNTVLWTWDLPKIWCSSVQFSSVAQLCPTLRPHESDLPVHHQFPEFTQTHVHRVGDAIQPSHPLSSPSPPAPKSLPASASFPMSQLFAWGGQSTGVSTSVSVLPVNTQDWSSLGWTGWVSLQSKGLSRVFSNLP